ncbi:FMRFamide-related neuropeptides-like [Argonauta hians]
MGGLSPFSLLLLIFIYCLTVYASTAMTLAQACLDSPSMCKKISLSDISSEEALKNKRFLRPGRALSGDAFLRFGKNVGPSSDKEFIRFGKGDRTVEEMVKEYLENAILTNSNSRQKRSTDVMPQNTIQDDNSKITKRNAESSDNSLDKKFMKFGKSNDLPYVNEWSDKRFMRFGREPDKRFMRFGKSDNKRFMRFGRNPYDLDDRIEEAKRFMRFGRANDVEDKRFMRFGRDPDYDNFGEDKRFMRFGRIPNEADAEKRFMRFGRSVNAVKPDISKEDANE